jgi:16S rRNA (cytidine1402-2'-O)-methyltransferase
MTEDHAVNLSNAKPLAAGTALVLVSTPIGNLKDMSVRGRETLEQVDGILCEDTRSSQTLLRHYGIATRCYPLHEHNEEQRIPGLIQAMQGGARYALISDAGTPLVSDPGYRLTRAAIDAGLRVGGPGADPVGTAAASVPVPRVLAREVRAAASRLGQAGQCRGSWAQRHPGAV